MDAPNRRTAWVWVAAAIVIVAVIAVIVIVTKQDRRASEANATTTENSPTTTAVGADSLPPWPAPSDATAAAGNAGLPMLSSEGMAEHIHVHLDVLVDGKRAQVPANIGIDTARRAISPLHTHDDSGVIHVESPVKREFSLGEFFTEWGVSLSADNIGGLRATDGKTVRTYVNGQARTGDPAAIMFAQHDEIALVYGSPEPGDKVPSTYEFPPGD
ncbi:hypothetical protein [Mycobacterium sp.]|uniref:hypothetical protein n=1 Tax=Mycobacterium sp. TaxID=1785 RepID=UPI002D0639C0|nr:hypothetical protein [Mycobacterium sp.]HKP43659.1 hypothetical protein [Mycobacterium sp.]